MPVVTIVPGNLEIEVAAGETLAQAAWRQGYHWPTTCWGEMQCMVCATVVRSGEAVPASAAEETAISERMPRFRQQPGTRLACQLLVTGDSLVVEKEGVRLPADPGS
ncbi:MAG TPA: 2Fe-2S iron-sulfur cluster-binding protein [Halioglobus sp.]